MLTWNHEVPIRVGAWVLGYLVFWKKPEPDTAAKAAL